MRSGPKELIRMDQTASSMWELNLVPRFISVQRLARRGGGRMNMEGMDGSFFDFDVSESSKKGKRYGSKVTWRKGNREIYEMDHTITLKDPQKLSDTAQLQRVIQAGEDERDPVIFDLNGDGSTQIQGGARAKNALSLPQGVWSLNVTVAKDNTRLTINDANKGGGQFASEQMRNHSINASGQWIIGVETHHADNDVWNSLKLSHQQQGDVVTITGPDFSMTAEKTSDGGYVGGEMGITNVDGSMQLFDMDPDKASWEKNSTVARPADGAPAVVGGRVEYRAGTKTIATDTIGADGRWTENENKGMRAKCSTAQMNGSENGSKAPHRSIFTVIEMIENAPNG